MIYDAFICHASEDKESVARPVAELLQKAGARIWYDEFELKLGDPLAEKIDAGLAQSRFGVVVISRRFLEKPWPQRELRGLISREVSARRKILLPVWHDISEEEVIAVSPPLAGVLAVSTKKGLARVAKEILDVVRPDLMRASSGSLEGEYLVEGYDSTGAKYRGQAKVSQHEDVLVIESSIGARTYVCQGRINGSKLDVFGDFDVEYMVRADGSLVGAWGNRGLETLTPVDKPMGTKTGEFTAWSSSDS